jgi:MPBQ/MSBQ methyltransferase
VHEARFEDVALSGPFDLVLFSESFQYIAYALALDRAAGLLAPQGTILIADCFRSDAFRRDAILATVGGGHSLSAVRAHVASMPVEVTYEEEITAAVAPSIDLEQGLFRVFGLAFERIDGEVSAKRPWLHRVLAGGFRLLVPARTRARLMQRLSGEARTSEAFRANNHYMILRLRKRD